MTYEIKKTKSWTGGIPYFRISTSESDAEQEEEEEDSEVELEDFTLTPTKRLQNLEADRRQLRAIKTFLRKEVLIWKEYQLH